MMALPPKPSEIHLAVGSSNGSPAKNKAFKVDKLYLVSNAGSCFFNTRIAVGALNMVVTLYFSTKLHQMPPSGRMGKPSYMMVAMPPINGP